MWRRFVLMAMGVLVLALPVKAFAWDGGRRGGERHEVRVERRHFEVERRHDFGRWRPENRWTVYEGGRFVRPGVRCTVAAGSGDTSRLPGNSWRNENGRRGRRLPFSFEVSARPR